MENEKKSYCVRIPLLAVITVEVEAENEEEAIENAIKDCDLSIKTTSKNGYEIEEWDIYHKLVQGFVFYGSLSKAEAQESDFW